MVRRRWQFLQVNCVPHANRQTDPAASGSAKEHPALVRIESYGASGRDISFPGQCRPVDRDVRYDREVNDSRQIHSRLRGQPAAAKLVIWGAGGGPVAAGGSGKYLLHLLAGELRVDLKQ